MKLYTFNRKKGFKVYEDNIKEKLHYDIGSYRVYYQGVMQNDN